MTQHYFCTKMMNMSATYQAADKCYKGCINNDEVTKPEQTEDQSSDNHLVAVVPMQN